MQINVNDEVRVQLTDLGREQHRQEHDKLFRHWKAKEVDYHPPKEDEDGWSTWQLWRLMQCFGTYMGNGFPVPFKTNMILISREVMEEPAAIAAYAEGQANAK